MTTETMTIHKALCELKTLDSRIKKAIEGSVFVFANKHSNAKVSGKTISAYSDEVKSAYQSACDLIARRDAITRAVTLSNATTKVTIGGQEYTIAEAIEMKNHGIPMQQKLLDKLEGGPYRSDQLTDFFEVLAGRCKFKYWFFGHYHGDMVPSRSFALLYEQILRLKS